jgi:hypothetical protein
MLFQNFPEYKGKTFQLVGPDEYLYTEVYSQVQIFEDSWGYSLMRCRDIVREGNVTNSDLRK